MSPEHASARQADKLDLLIGAKAIASFLNASERQIYYWKEQKRFRFFQIGELIAARKSTLIEDLARLEAGEAV